MAKKKSEKRTSYSGGTSSTGGYMGVAKRGFSLLAGVALGSMLKGAIGKDNTQANGTDLLGLSGETSTMVTSGIVTAAGVLGTTMLKDSMLKDVALGVAVAGGAGIVNGIAGKPLVALGETEDQPVVKLLPGLGDNANIRYDELPDENAQVTTYNPVAEAGDIDISEVSGTQIL